MKKKILLNMSGSFFFKVSNYFNYKWIITYLMIMGVSLMGYTQKGNGNGNGNKPKDLVIRSCTTYIGNGLYSASFSYDNPTNQEINVAEDDSFVKYNNGNNKTKSLNKFKKGNVNKAFTKEFSSGGSVEWTVIQSNGKTHTVIASANSSHCTGEEKGFIFPVYKQGTGKSEEIIGQELMALAAIDAGTTPDSLIYQTNIDKVLIEIVPKVGEMGNVIFLLQNTFGLSYNADPSLSDFILDPDTLTFIDPVTLTSLTAIDVYFPISRLLELNTYPNKINFVRVLYPPIKNSAGDGFTGNAVSQGDATQKSDIVRESFRLIKNIDSVTTTVLPVDGTGVTIGVMSNSFDRQSFTGNSKATADVLAGDLPGNLNTHGYTDSVNVIKEYPYGTASDEGRAMMHIIHDVAPGAKLAFHTGSLSPRNFEVGFKALAGDNDLGVESNLIVDDITFITEPFFGESRISAAIEAFSAAGGIHFTSAGNFADNGFQGVFNATTTQPINNNFLEATAQAHIFDADTGDYLQEIAVKADETYMIVLQWDESSASQDNSIISDIDLDFYIVDDFGRLLVGNNRSNENGDAAEIMVFTATADGTANIMITSANGGTTVPFRYIAFQSFGLTLNQFNDGSPTISGHAMTEESVTVGAIRFNRDDPEDFSSFGGILSDSITVVKVDFAAPDGVNTNVGSIGTKTYADGTEVDGDIFNNFFGTSAAAPSAAAAVALLQSALPTWYPDGYNGDLIQLFKDNVKDGSIANDSLQAGAGMIDVNKVFNSLASQTARITSFTILDNEDGTTPLASVDTLKINVIGDFFPSPPSEGEPSPVKFYMDGVELTGTVLTNGYIEATIPPFSGNPELQVYTESKEGSADNSNGGFSEPYSFFQDGKIALTVKANPAATLNDDGSITQNPVTIKFGEDYKSKLTYTVEGVPEAGFLDENGDPATFEDIFPTVVFETTVDNLAYPDVNNYPVTPSFNDEPYDTDKYIVNFKNGDLVIEKNYLTIKPKDSTFNYGDIIRNTLIYQVTDADGNAITVTDEGDYAEIGDDGTVLKSISDFYFAIENAHQEDFYYDTFNEGNTEPLMLLINDFNQSLDTLGITTLLENGGWISSENSILNGLIRQQAIINDFRQSALINDFRQSAVINDFRVSAIMNTLRIDKSYFTNYIDRSLTNDTRQLAIMNDEWISDTEDIMNDFRQTGVINDYRVSAIMNDMRVGAIMNTIDVMDLNVDVQVNDSISRQLGIENDLRQLGVINDFRQSAVINSMRQSAIINENNPGAIMKDKVFSLIDYTDAPADNPGFEIQNFYSLNLITGVEVTNGQAHLVFPGAFLNSMAANFYIRYDKGNLTIEEGTLTAETSSEPEVFSSNYGTPLTDKEIPTTFTTVETNFELIEAIFPDGIPYYFMKEGDPTEYTLDGEDKMSVGLYDIFIRDEADNYVISNSASVIGGSIGLLDIVEAPLTVNTTTAANIEYGTDKPGITSNISGFADGESEDDLKVNGEIPYFFMKKGETPDCETCIKYYLPYVIGTDKMDVGEYDIFITDDPNDNYIIGHASGRGTLTVIEAQLTVNTTTAANIKYGYGGTPMITTNITHIDDPDVDVSTVVFPDPDQIPYFFMKQGETPDCETCIKYYLPHVIGSDKMDVGVYDIFITDEPNDNYIIGHASGRGTITVDKANLTVIISPDNLIIDQGDTPGLTASFGPFAYADENEFNVFQPDGIIYYFVDEDGYEQSTADAGVLTVKIEDPTNYVIVYNNEAKLFINPDDVDKIRTYADCVAYDPSASDKLYYTVVYRYENDNVDPIYVPEGVDNILSGPAQFEEGQLPVTFLPGTGTFEIRFNGKKLVWSLTTGGSTHKTSVSSANTSGTGECDAKLDGAYSIGPNPVTSSVNYELSITNNTIEVSDVFVYNMYGSLVITGPSFNGTIGENHTVDMSGEPNGLYIVRIISASKVRTYNIIKQQ